MPRSSTRHASGATLTVAAGRAPTTTRDVTLGVAIRRQHGLVTARQLRDHGLGPEEIERLRSRHTLTRLHPDLYRTAMACDDFETACAAPCLAHPIGAIGGPSAAALWDFDHLYRPFRPEFLVPDPIPVAHRLRRITYRPTPTLCALDVVERSDGIRVLDRAATWFDCVGELGPLDAASFTHHVLDVHCDPDELWAVVDRWEAGRRRRSPGRSHRLLVAAGAKRSRRAA